MSQQFIYGLEDPRDGTVFYVGQTTVGAREPLGYIRHGHKGRLSRKICRHLRHLWKRGIVPTWSILEEVPEESLNDAELFWIGSLRSAGAILMNVADGGQHASRAAITIGFRRARAEGKLRRTDAQREVIRQNSRRQFEDPEQRRKAGAANHGKLPHNAQVVTIEGMTFPSFGKAAQHYGLSVCRFKTKFWKQLGLAPRRTKAEATAHRQALGQLRSFTRDECSRGGITATAKRWGTKCSR